MIFLIHNIYPTTTIEQVTAFLQTSFVSRWILTTLSSRYISSIASNIFFKSSISKSFIPLFIDQYKIDASKFTPPNDAEYISLNDFFIRKFRQPPIFAATTSMFSACCEGLITVIPDLKTTDSFFIKSHNFTLERFLQNKDDASYFSDGATLIIIRLQPKHYHRIHMPTSGEILSQKCIDGKLVSVAPIAFTQWQNPLIKNFRQILWIQSTYGPKFIMAPVGAMFVGSIIITAKQKTNIVAGEDIGYFEFGGSTVVLLFRTKDFKPDKTFLPSCQEQAIEIGTIIGQYTNH